MLDGFALLNLPRQPWLEPQEVQARFLALSFPVHPDRVHNASPEEKASANQRFAELNAAWQCLRSPKERARHLLELERGKKPEQLESLPSTGMDYFFEIGQLCGQVDEFLSKKDEADSPLFQVRFFGQAMKWKDRLEEVRSALQGKSGELEAELKKLNDAWQIAPEIGDPQRPLALPLGQLEKIYRGLSYLGRWSEQVRDRTVQLMV